ncbi:uncharacterized protein [Haliotis cracherodii]|uniref:uncharacterized protein n=1 Tax=Haliotis cracherodii TaxID=6455 RepID=UPI0039E7D1D2
MAANFVTSLMTRLRGRGQKKSPDEKKKRRSCIVSWFSTSDLDNVDEDSTFLFDDSGLDVTSGPRSPSRRDRDSGYIGRFSSHEDVCSGWILEDSVCIDLERGEVITCFNPEQDMIRKAESLSSLVRCTSIQDRSLKVTRKRRQNMAKRNRRNKYLSFKKAIFPDEGIDVTSGEGCTTDDSSDEIVEPPMEKKVSPTEKRRSKKALDDYSSDEVVEPPKEKKVSPNEKRRSKKPLDVIVRQNSVQKKSWEIRRRRKQELQKKRRSANLEASSDAARVE